jgi:hypothetical protein
MRTAKLEGLGLLDLALVHPKTESVPEDVSLHFHGVARSIDPNFKPKKAGLVASGNKPTNKEGLKIVSIRAYASPLQWSGLAGLLYYVAKLSCGTKASGERDARTSHAFWTWVVALRGLEVLSHCEALENLRGVGEFGRALRTEAKSQFQRLLGVDRLPRGMAIDHDKLSCEWARVYDALGMPDLKPFTVK